MAANIPARLKRWRKQQGLTQEEAARKLNICLNTWSNWERGRTSPSKMAQALLVLGGVLELEDKKK